jgi:predicted AAA+ superfamily ATPase
MNKDTFKRIIITQLERLRLPAHPVKRVCYTALSEAHALPHALIVSGIRRCGKSTVLTQLLEAEHPQDFYFLNFDDERLVGFEATDFDALHETFVELFGVKKIFFFDEIQNVLGWEAYVRRMQDTGIKFYITGSNSALLSSEISSKLTGRHRDFEEFPFSFTEYLAFKKFEINPCIDFYNPETRGLIKQHFNYYLKNGGFPEYLKYEDKEILSTIYEDILFKDIVVRYEIQDIKALREIALFLISNLANPFSYNKLKSLTQLGSVNTVKNYVQYLENSYLIFTLNQFSFSLKEQILTTKKIYVIDNGLVDAVAFQFPGHSSNFLENLVFLECRRRYKEIYFYKTENNLEVDFLIRKGNKIEQLIQVTEHMNDDSTRHREIKALTHALRECKLNEGLILTLDHKEMITVENLQIQVLPIWEWLLQT